VSPLNFTKSHGLGNDFVLVEQSVSARQARAICAPRRGVGADGVISVTAAESSSGRPDDASDEPTARMTIRNADGSRPDMCGNGLRCAVRYLDDAGHWDGRGQVVIETDAGPRLGRVISRGSDAWQVEVSMGEGRLDEPVEVAAPDPLAETVRLQRVDMGNPHAVAFGVDWDVESIAALGEQLNDGHEHFPDGVNLEVVRPTATDRLLVTVFERGVGLTDACGSGACAVAMAAWEQGERARGEVTEVELPGGVLTVERRDDEIWLTGPAVQVFEGRMNEDAWSAAMAYED
jgi:diaminopimelate epimerase